MITRMERKNMLADDILQIEEAEQSALVSKVRFLNKVKSRSAELNNEWPMEDVQTGPQVNIHSTLKRIFDILVSLTTLLLLSPLFLLIALAIRIESRGPIFYISKRAGRGYKIFDFYKFRTMFAGADLRIKEYSHLNQYNGNDSVKGPSFFKFNNDPRITRVGNFLRNTSLDELPQLMNVLLGDMYTRPPQRTTIWSSLSSNGIRPLLTGKSIARVKPSMGKEIRLSCFPKIFNTVRKEPISFSLITLRISTRPSRACNGITNWYCKKPRFP